MVPEDLIDKVLTDPNWHPMPSMCFVDPHGYMLPYILGCSRHPSYPDEYDWPHDLGLRVPDFSHPGTRGCLLQLVLNAGAQIRKLCILPMGATLVVEWKDGRLDDWRTPTLEEALCKALLAAPKEDTP